MTKTLRDGLRRRGHDVKVFASDLQADHPGNFADLTCSARTGPLQALHRTCNPSAVLRLRTLLRSFQPDVVHVRMFLTQLSPAILPLLAPYPSIFHVTDYACICPRITKQLPDGSPCNRAYGLVCLESRCVSPMAWAPLMAQLAAFRAWRGSFDRIIANSHATREALMAHDLGPVDVIWNGVPVTPARPALTGPPTVGYAGRLTPEKGVDVLIKAMARLANTVPDAQAIIAGEGSESDRLKELAQKLGVANRVKFLGRLERSELERVFEGVWVQAVPSRWREPFGLVAAEASMRGTAVVVSDGGGLAEIIEPEKTGMVVPPDDLPSLAAALERLLLDRATAERMGRAARERALQLFSEEVVLSRFENCYFDLLGGPREWVKPEVNVVHDLPAVPSAAMTVAH